MTEHTANIQACIFKSQGDELIGTISTGWGCVNIPNSNEEFRASALLAYRSSCVWCRGLLSRDGQERCGKPVSAFYADWKNVKGNKQPDVRKQHQTQLTWVDVFQTNEPELNANKGCKGWRGTLFWG